MTYRDGFDRLGNPVSPYANTRLHRAIQRAGWTVAAVCLAALIWLR